MTAEQKFREQKVKAISNLQKIKAAVEKMERDFNKGDKKDWCYAGDLGHVNEELFDLMMFLNV